MKVIPYLLIISLLNMFQLLAQEADVLHLEQAVTLARQQSVAQKLAENIRENRFYEYQIFKSQYRPQLNLFGGFPNYSKDYFDVRQPDGGLAFIARSQNTTYLGLGLTQKIALTGGQLSISTNLTRFDDFERKSHAYNGTPINIQFIQPLFVRNTNSRLRKIEKMKLEEANKTYILQNEIIAQETVQLFFDLLDAQENIRIAADNLKNNQLILRIEKKREKLGTTSKDRLLQIELQLLQARQAAKNAEVAFENALLELNTFLGLDDDIRFQLGIPENLPQLLIDEAFAYQQASHNRPEYIGFQRRSLEADLAVVEARNERFQVDLMASFGLNGTGGSFTDIYSGLQDQQRFSVGINVPILDWGRSEARLKSQLANQKVIQYAIRQEEISFRKEIYSLIRNLRLIYESLDIAIQTDTIASQRYQLAIEQYQIGKYNLTDLGIALNEKDRARRTYINNLRSFWLASYELRRLTLYDFEQQKTLYKTIE